jgi:hypothetical protein
MSRLLDEFDAESEGEEELVQTPTGGLQPAGSFVTAPSSGTTASPLAATSPGTLMSPMAVQGAALPGLGGLQVTNEQFQMWMEFQRQLAPAPVVAPVVNPPRVGGRNHQGFWTGHGLNNEGNSPRTLLCMRYLFKNGLKELNAIGEIELKASKGLKSIPDSPKFSMSSEKDADKVHKCIRQLELFCEQHGLEGVFHIVKPDGTTLNMFKRPALANKTIVLKWIEDLTVNGVYQTTTTRLPLCQFDKICLQLSGQAVLNSCSPDMRETIDRLFPDMKDHQGPRLFVEILQNCRPPSRQLTDTLVTKLKALDIRTIKGQNVSMYQQKALEIVDEIYMSVLDEHSVPELTVSALRGLERAADEKVRRLATNYIDKLDKDSTIKLDPAIPLGAINHIYVQHVQRDAYMLDTAPAALQAEVANIKRTLEQDKSKGKKDSKEIVCYGCNKKGHKKPDCPEKGKKADQDAEKKTNASSNSTSSSSDKLNKLIKKKLKSLSMPVPEDAVHEIKMDGKVVAKYCSKCKRFTKGKSIHSTAEHKSKKDNPDAKAKQEAKEAPAEPSLTASLAVIAPTTVEQALGLWRCDIPDYDTHGADITLDSDDESIDSAHYAFMAGVYDQDEDDEDDADPEERDGHFHDDWPTDITAEAMEATRTLGRRIEVAVQASINIGRAERAAVDAEVAIAIAESRAVARARAAGMIIAPPPVIGMEQLFPEGYQVTHPSFIASSHVYAAVDQRTRAQFLVVPPEAEEAPTYIQVGQTWTEYIYRHMMWSYHDQPDVDLSQAPTVYLSPVVDAAFEDHPILEWYPSYTQPAHHVVPVIPRASVPDYDTPVAGADTDTEGPRALMAFISGFPTASSASTTQVDTTAASDPRRSTRPDTPHPGSRPSLSHGGFFLEYHGDRICVDADGELSLVDGSGPEATHFRLDHPFLKDHPLYKHTYCFRLKGFRGQEN